MAAHMASTAFAAADGLSTAVETGARERLAGPLQLAATQALVASVLAPAPHAPPFLPLALKLLRQVPPQWHNVQRLHARPAKYSVPLCCALLHPPPLPPPMRPPSCPLP